MLTTTLQAVATGAINAIAQIAQGADPSKVFVQFAIGVGVSFATAIVSAGFKSLLANKAISFAEDPNSFSFLKNPFESGFSRGDWTKLFELQLVFVQQESKLYHRL